MTGDRLLRATGARLGVLPLTGLGRPPVAIGSRSGSPHWLRKALRAPAAPLPGLTQAPACSSLHPKAVGLTCLNDLGHVCSPKLGSTLRVTSCEQERVPNRMSVSSHRADASCSQGLFSPGRSSQVKKHLGEGGGCSAWRVWQGRRWGREPCPHLPPPAPRAPSLGVCTVRGPPGQAVTEHFKRECNSGTAEK